jgi:hypothetical protein
MEKFSHQRPHQETQETRAVPGALDLERRKVLRGLLAGYGLSLVPLAVHAEPDETTPEKESESLTEDRIEEALALLGQEFQHFDTLAKEHREHFINELPHALPFALKETLGDPERRSRLAYLETAFALTGFELLARQVLARCMAAKAFVESGFNADATSEDGAKGVLQIMEATFQQHARTPDANIRSLVEQVYAAEGFLEETRQVLENRCQDALDGIQAHWFAGDRRRFVEEFYVPCVLNAYNTGPARMAEVITVFAQTFLRHEYMETLRGYGIGDQRYDVFLAMTQLTGMLGTVSRFGPDSQAYVPKILAAREVLDAAREDGELMAALGAAREDTEG